MECNQITVYQRSAPGFYLFVRGSEAGLIAVGHTTLASAKRTAAFLGLTLIVLPDFRLLAIACFPPSDPPQHSLLWSMEYGPG